jgi:hypothetical protein
VCPKALSARLQTTRGCWDATQAMEALSTLWMGSLGTVRGVPRRMGLDDRVCMVWRGLGYESGIDYEKEKE